MSRIQHIEFASDIDKASTNGYNQNGFEFYSGVMMSSKNILSNHADDTLVKYCIAASLVLHLIVFASASRMNGLMPERTFLNPGEKVQAVRLVEPQNTENKVEPPPSRASAVSDRDHSAVKERIPRSVPSSEPPLGRIDPPEKRIAALIPPRAPEDLTEPTEEKKTPEAQDRDAVEEKAAGKTRARAKASPAPKPTKNEVRGRKLDLKPNRQEQEIATGLSGRGGTSEFFPEGDLDEAVVDINTREEKFFSYLLHLKRKIQGVWVYPSSAANSGLGGSLTVEFSIAKDGELLYVNLLDSSGHQILDESAVRAIRNAAPYFPFPPRMRAKRLRIRANFIYITSNYFRRIM